MTGGENGRLEFFSRIIAQAAWTYLSKRTIASYQRGVPTKLEEHHAKFKYRLFGRKTYTLICQIQIDF